MLLALISWRFATRDELEMKCQVCKLITKRFAESRPEDSNFTVNGTFCGENPEHRICEFANDVISQIQGGRDVKSLCRNMQACPQLPNIGKPLLEGTRCKQCLKLATHVMAHSKGERKEALFRYCMTGHVPTLGFCGEIIDDGVDDFIEDMLEMEQVSGVCSGRGYCLAPGARRVTRRKAFIGDDIIEIFVL